jgi:hypothetical protein
MVGYLQAHTTLFFNDTVNLFIVMDGTIIQHNNTARSWIWGKFWNLSAKTLRYNNINHTKRHTNSSDTQLMNHSLLMEPSNISSAMILSEVRARRTENHCPQMNVEHQTQAQPMADHLSPLWLVLSSTLD